MGFYLKYTVMCGLCEEYLHAAYAFCKTTQRDLRERVKIDRLPLQMELSLFFFSLFVFMLLSSHVDF